MNEAPDHLDAPRDADSPSAPQPLGYFSPTAAFRRLTPRGAALLACRVVALLIAAQVAQSVGYLLTMVSTMFMTPGSRARFGGDNWTQLLSLLPAVVVPVAVAALLWWKADWLAARMIGVTGVPGGTGTATAVPGGLPDASAGPSAEAVPAADGAGSARTSDTLGGRADPATSLARPALDPEEEVRPLLSVALTAAGAFLLVEALPEFVRPVLSLLMSGRSDAASVLTETAFEVPFWSAVLKTALALWLLLGAGGLARAIRRLRHPDARPAESASADGPRSGEGPEAPGAPL